MRSNLRGIGITLVALVLAVGLSVVYTNHVDQRRIEGERRAAVAREKSAEELRAATCATVLEMDEFYRSEPPPNDRAQKLAKVWTDLRLQLGCGPSK